MGPSEDCDGRDQGSRPRKFEQLIGNSPALETVLDGVKRVAPTSSTVLIQGETGYWQGTDRTRDSQYQPAVRTPVRQAELRCHPTGSPGKRALWPRKGRVHRSYRAEAWPLRVGR